MLARFAFVAILLVPSFGYAQLDAGAEADDESSPRTWQDPDLEWWPWLVSVPLFATALTIDATISPDSARWSGAGPIDRAFESWIASSPAGRRRAARVSDAFLGASFAAPILDAVLWHRKGTSRARFTYRLLMIDGLSLALTGLVSVATKHVVRRARPYDVPCRADESYSGSCDSSSRFQSFISGHSAISFTGAALVCAHQVLRGRSPLGHIQCAMSLATASITGAMRIVAERHYVSDVAVGAVVGFLSGYLLPMLFRRSFPPDPPPMHLPRAW